MLLWLISFKRIKLTGDSEELSETLKQLNALKNAKQNTDIIMLMYKKPLAGLINNYMAEKLL